jgi:hypothetical protein
MPEFDWKTLMVQWSRAVLESDLYPDDETELPDESFGWMDDFGIWHSKPLEKPAELMASGWLGYPGASEEQIQQLENRLGLPLPPSYREFLKLSNGWRRLNEEIYKLWSTKEVDWFAANYQGFIDGWMSSNCPISDEEYFVYGDEQRPTSFRAEYLQAALQISKEGNGVSFYLLNPKVITKEGEWEAWFFSTRLAGVSRYRSFWDLMNAEFEIFLKGGEK